MASEASGRSGLLFLCGSQEGAFSVHGTSTPAQKKIPLFGESPQEESFLFLTFFAGSTELFTVLCSRVGFPLCFSFSLQSLLAPHLARWLIPPRSLRSRSFQRFPCEPIPVLQPPREVKNWGRSSLAEGPEDLYSTEQ